MCLSFSFAFALKSVSFQLAWFPCSATRIPGDIPTDKVFQVGLTCWEAHPGVCRTDAAGQWNIIEVAGSALLKAGLAKGFVEGSVVRLRVKFGIFVEQMFFFTAPIYEEATRGSFSLRSVRPSMPPPYSFVW